MAARTVRAVRRKDGVFEPREPVAVPTGTVVELRVEETEPAGRAPVGEFPVFPGDVLGRLRRADLHADR